MTIQLSPPRSPKKHVTSYVFLRKEWSFFRPRVELWEFSEQILLDIFFLICVQQNLKRPQKSGKMKHLPTTVLLVYSGRFLDSSSLSNYHGNGRGEGSCPTMTQTLGVLISLRSAQHPADDKNFIPLTEKQILKLSQYGRF